MRLIHLADLHFGKSMHGLSLLEKGDQAHWVTEFLRLAEELRPDAVMIAGDVYDRSAPSGDAVELLSRMLTALSDLDIPTLLVAGNHDSAQRLAFAGPLLARQKLFISRPLAESPELLHVTLTDEYGPVTFWLMPYVFPALAAQALGDESLRDCDTALRVLLQRQNVDFSQRNVLIAHQNVTAGGREALRGGSETMVGGVGQVDYTAFDGFDYVALGHIHAACPVGRDSVRYAGSPLCYHFDEIHQAAKGPLLVELGAKGEAPRIERLPIAPLHPLREMKGAYTTLRDAELAHPRRGEYLRLVLTDRRLSPEVVDFFEGLARERDSVLMDRSSEYDPFSSEVSAPSRSAVEQKSVGALFADFYAERSGGEMPTEAELRLLQAAEELALHEDFHLPPSVEAVERLLRQLAKEEEA